MTTYSEQDLDARYRQSFGYVAGYLPRDRNALIAWQVDLQTRAAARFAERGAVGRHPSVQAMADLINADSIVRMYVIEAIEQSAAFKKNVLDIDDMLAQLDLICTTAPEYNADPKARVLFPMSALFVNMMATQAGKALFRLTDFNERLRAILKTWADYLDSADSCWVLNRNDTNGWLGRAATEEFKLRDFVVDWSAEHGGFASYNAFFHREIQSEYRPIAGVGDAAIVTSPNDGTVYRIDTNVQADGVFWLKERDYSLRDMLDHPDDALLRRFVGGTVVQIFLSGADYHRWHAPVDGVVSFRNVDGLLFSENEDHEFDPDAGVKSQVYGAAVNNRALVSIEADDARLGSVYVMPIGITEISSLTLVVKDGQHVKKGEELGYFNYGGSTLCVVFEKKVPLDFGSLAVGDTIKVNAKLATVK
ncbi:phosphatidylserine decarboxylase family protein [Burkholderia plantarii]|uniref:Phosphatidylserine decarboxylase-like protein n=1 Tax=Burkholderia plantarii TaxID=41899 RepID=A0A0B6RTI8_BURPL|nr:phosphatidylserine decarboxylase family protein [Burkholderia plantarii]AJK46713.1 phosphatidylserine decarboxylase-like protein [Burkholderia plantarii]